MSFIGWEVRTETYFLYILCVISDILYLLQSDWLQERAALYDILTAVQNSYFLATNRGVKTCSFQTQNATGLYTQKVETRY